MSLKIYRLSPMETRAWENDEKRTAIRQAVQDMADSYGHTYEIVSSDDIVMDVRRPADASAFTR